MIEESGRVPDGTGLLSTTEPQSSQGLVPSGFDPSRLRWYGPELLPEYTLPVIAEYHPWNTASNPVRYQTVWHFNGEWRTFPSTEDLAYVNRWAYLQFAPRDSDGSGEAGETAKTGSTEGDSAGPKDIARKAVP